MRIHVLSDLHLEFSPFIAPQVTAADVVILAGDIHVKGRGFPWARQAFEGPVRYVPGNHEFYGGHSHCAVNYKIAGTRVVCNYRGYPGGVTGFDPAPVLKAKDTAVRKAQVTVLGNNFTITTNRYVFNLLQTEAVSERVLPAVLRVGLYDDAGEAVSAVELASLDSDSQNLDQRQRKVILTLLNRPFSSSERYFLRLLDAETDVEQFRIDVRINLAISNDFDF